MKRRRRLSRLTLISADPKNGGANPTMVRILRSVNDKMSQSEIIDEVSLIVLLLNIKIVIGIIRR